jgi:hypothetical protein
MEKIGAVNVYSPYQRQNPRAGGHGGTPPDGAKSFFVINLANGTTPFMLVLDKVEYASACYNLTGRLGVAVTVKYAHYRPTREEFEKLDINMQSHVLLGGLLFGEIGKVVQLPNDPVDATWDFEMCQQFFFKTYGRRRKTEIGIHT